MSWQTLSFHLRQKYDGGFRYFDRCGEFMIAAVKSMDFIPGDIKPVGANLEIPEKNLKANVDAYELVVAQEMPEDNKFFISACVEVSRIANEIFQPTGIISNGFAAKYFWPIPNVDALQASTLKFDSREQNELGKKLGVLPAHKLLHFGYKSGSMELEFKLQPATFENVVSNRQTPHFKATSVVKQRADRFNKALEKFNRPLSHALILEVDLVEKDPPVEGLIAHYDQMLSYVDTLKKEYVVK